MPELLSHFRAGLGRHALLAVNVAATAWFCHWGQWEVVGANFSSSVPSSVSHTEEGTLMLEILRVHLEVLD